MIPPSFHRAIKPFIRESLMTLEPGCTLAIIRIGWKPNANSHQVSDSDSLVECTMAVSLNLG
jgi:hypothetical protein